MIRIVSLLACASLLLSPAFCAPFSPNPPTIDRNTHAKRAEPNTGNDHPDVAPHPYPLEKAKKAFNDAELAPRAPFFTCYGIGYRTPSLPTRQEPNFVVDECPEGRV